MIRIIGNEHTHPCKRTNVLQTRTWIGVSVCLSRISVVRLLACLQQQARGSRGGAKRKTQATANVLALAIDNSFTSTMGSSDAAESGPKPKTQPHLMPQDAKTVDPSKLTALSPEVVSNWY
jgi:hypothetical protein